jgi:GAF domain-containing protein
VSRNVDMDVDRARIRLAGAIEPLFATDPLPDRLARLLESIYGPLEHVDAYGVVVLDGDDVLATVASDPLVHELHDVQRRLQAGPCWEIRHGDRPTVVHDAITAEATADAADDFRAAAAALGVRSQMTTRIQPRKRLLGAVTVLSTSADVVPVEEAGLELVAQLAGVAVDQAFLRDGIEDGLRGRTVIGMATGLLMERLDLDEDAALAHLKRESSTTHRKLRAVAEDLVRASGRRSRTP